jgi:hypothetical protein
MSRSYKHTPYCGDTKDRAMKRAANRKVRRALKRDLDMDLSYKSYKKYFCSYDICDYYFLYPYGFEQFYQDEIKHWYNWMHRYEEFPDKEKIQQYFRKWYLAK